MNITCGLKERYDKVRHAEYKMENINRAKVFLQFLGFSSYEKMPLGIIEVKSESLKNIFRSIADYNLKSYFNLLSSLVQGYLLDSDAYSEGGYKIKVIKNKRNNKKTEAIFNFSAFILSDYISISNLIINIFKFSINEAFISKEFLIKLAESSKIFYRDEVNMIEAIDNFILFLEKSHTRFFLIFFDFSGEYILRLVPNYLDNLSIKFIFEPKETDIYDVNYSGLELVEAVKKEEYLKLKLKDLVNIVNPGGSKYEKEMSVKKLIRGVFMNLLFYYFSNEELPEFKKSNSASFSPGIKVEYRYDFLKEKARKVPLLSSFMSVLEAISNIPDGYKSKDIFEGNLSFITMEVESNNHSIEIKIYCSIKSDYSKAKNEEIFLEIKVKTQTYHSYVNISVAFYKDSFIENIYMNEQNLDIFISDFGKFLTKLGLFSHPNEFLFLARYAKVVQMIMP